MEWRRESTTDKSPRGASAHQTDMNGLEEAVSSALNPMDLQKFLAFTLIMCKKQREPPLYTTEAQIFVLDHKSDSGSRWQETSSRPVSVHLYHDLNRRSFRIISVEGSKPILNATISPSVKLKKTSSKFLQWADSKSSFVYGLGFSSDKELNKFVDKVIQIQGMAEKTYAADARRHSRDATLDSNFLNLQKEPDISGNDQMIKLENERLKAALAQSSANAKKWEEELASLKAINEELKEALSQTSHNTQGIDSADTEKICNDSDMEFVLSQLSARMISDDLQEEVLGREESRSPEELLDEIRGIIRLKQDLQKRLGERETNCVEWKNSVSVLSKQIGEKLKELQNLQEKLHLLAE